MKALLINGSPRTNGCTFTVLTELKNTLEKRALMRKLSMWDTKTYMAVPLTENARKQVKVYLTIL